MARPLKLEAARESKYEYQDLEDIAVEGDEVLHNFFAVIMEATFPHKSSKLDRYFCTLRVADPTSGATAEGIAECCTLVLIANKFEELPICHRVGDIIRVHRATVHEYLGVKQLTARVYFNSAWVLFSAGNAKSAAKEFQPIAHLGKTYSLVSQSEQKVITQLRTWAKKALAKLPMVGKKAIEVADLNNYHDEGKEGYRFDLIAKILSITRVDEKLSEIQIKEGDDIWKTTTSTFKYRWLREGETVLIKDASLYGTEKDSKTFVLASKSNIMSLPHESALSQ